MNRKVAIHNLGCKVNSYEAEIMQQSLIEKGYEIVAFEEKADIYIVNTCSVTNIADRKSRQMLHRAKKLNPDALVVAAGCYVQTREAEEILADGVDLILGNNKKTTITELLEEYYTDNSVNSAVADIACESLYENMHLIKTAEHTRAYIKIQDGCNQFCSYCIIPFARGRVRSRRYEDIIAEIEGLTEKGYKEFVLTGIHISSYGLDWADKAAADRNDFVKHSRLIDIVEKVSELAGVERIRLGSIEPRIVTEEFARRLAGINKVCPHFHLSLQSGCDDTLKRMNRHYTAEEYYNGVELLRKYFTQVNNSKPAITTDIIVGFPGESNEAFEECRAFVDKVDFFETHIFKYSKRQGTKAAKMSGQLTEREKTERSQVLLELCREKKHQYILELMEDKDYCAELLVEEYEEIEGISYQVGHTREYVRAAIVSDTDYTGQIVKGRIREIKPGAEEFAILEIIE